MHCDRYESQSVDIAIDRTRRGPGLTARKQLCHFFFFFLFFNLFYSFTEDVQWLFQRKLLFSEDSEGVQLFPGGGGGRGGPNANFYRNPYNL